MISQTWSKGSIGIKLFVIPNKCKTRLLYWKSMDVI